MGSLGTYVRSAREARGLDLREAAQQTRISVSYLKAIEDEDFSKLPGEVFVKGFLKSYAKFLRLPEDEIVKRYAEVVTPQPPASAARASAVPKPPKTQAHVPQRSGPAETHPSVPADEQPGRLGLEPFLWGGAVIIGLVAFILTALPQKHKTGGHAPIVASQGTATAGIVSAPSETVRPEKLYLEIVALDDIWVLVRTDASPQKKAVLKKGETVTWSADERFLLSYASIGAAKLMLNGKELTVNGPKSAVVRDLIVTASGITLQKVEADLPRPRKTKPVTQATSTARQQQSTTPEPLQPQSLTTAAAPSAPPAVAPSPAPAPRGPQQVAPIFQPSLEQ